MLPRNSKRVQVGARLPPTIADLNHDTMQCIVAFLDSHERRCLSLALRSGKDATEDLVIPELLDTTADCPDACMCLRRKSSVVTAYAEYQRRAILHGHTACLEHWHKKAGKWTIPALDAAFATGDLALVQRIREEHPRWKVSNVHLFDAAESGNAECLAYALANGTWRLSVLVTACKKAIVHDNGALLGLFPAEIMGWVPMARIAEYVYETGLWASIHRLTYHGVSDDARAEGFVRGGGRLGHIPAALVNGLREVVKQRIIDCNPSAEDVRWLTKNGFYVPAAEDMKRAALDGAIDVMRVLHEEYAIPIPATIPKTIRRIPYHEYIRYLHEHGSGWPAGFLEAFVKYGSRAGVAYAIDHGCPQTGDLVGAAIRNPPVLWMLLTRYRMQPAAGVVDIVVQGRHWQTLPMLFEHGLPASDTLIGELAGHVGEADLAPYVRVAHQHGCPIPSDAIFRFIKSSRYTRFSRVKPIPVLKLLHELGGAYNYNKVLRKAKKRNLEDAVAYIEEYM